MQERRVTHIAVVASCEICELFLEGDRQLRVLLLRMMVPQLIKLLVGEYVGSARAQHPEGLQNLTDTDAKAASESPHDLGKMRLMLFDCTDVAKGSSKIMLRLRRSISALAPDISLGIITIYSSIIPPRAQAPVMDIEKASQCHPVNLGSPPGS